MGSKIAVIVPARGGSTRLPRKNLLRLGGIPLVQIACIQGLNLGDVFVSTEDNEIKESVVKAGYPVIDRPLSLAQDDSPGIEVVHHAVRALAEYDQFVLLQPTTPFRKCRAISEIIKDIEETHSSALSIAVDGRFIWTMDKPIGRPFNFRPRSQDKEPIRLEDGAVYWFKRDVLNRRDYHDEKPYFLPGVIAPDIDTQEELDTARMLWGNQWLTM